MTTDLKKRYDDLMARCHAANLSGSLRQAVDTEAETLFDYRVKQKLAKRGDIAARAAETDAIEYYVSTIEAFLAEATAQRIYPDDVLYYRTKAVAKAIAVMLREHETAAGLHTTATERA